MVGDDSTNLTPEKERRGAGEWVPVFLLTLRQSGNVRQSCEAAGISRVEAYKRKERNKAFEKQWQDALDDACDLIEAEARRRALASSDLLIMFLLKAHRRSVYGDQSKVNVAGPNDEPLLPLEALRTMFLRAESADADSDR